MHDTSERSFTQTVYPVAARQKGYLTTAQMTGLGFANQIIAHHVQTGALIRVLRGVYRLRDYPHGLYEDVMAAWLALDRDTAIVSHESALEIHALSDVIPHAIHLTLPRTHRYRIAPPGTRLHTVAKPLDLPEIVTRESMRITSVARTIVDCAQSGTGPEQIDMAIKQALEQGLTTERRLVHAAAEHGGRVRTLIEAAIARAKP